MHLFKSRDANTMERNLLRIYEDAYPEAVATVATALREKFRAGKLRGFRDGDLDRKYEARPWHRLERECERRFITTPARALGVLAHSKNRRHAEAWRWDWRRPMDCGLQGAAASVMAVDVLFYARAQGWSTPTPDEDPKPTRKPARKAVRS